MLGLYPLLRKYLDFLKLDLVARRSDVQYQIVRRQPESADLIAADARATVDRILLVAVLPAQLEGLDSLPL